MASYLPLEVLLFGRRITSRTVFLGRWYLLRFSPLGMRDLKDLEDDMGELGSLLRRRFLPFLVFVRLDGALLLEAESDDERGEPVEKAETRLWERDECEAPPPPRPI